MSGGPEEASSPESAGYAGQPWRCLEAWLRDAEASGAPEPTAMALATASLRGVPSVRYVLFKGRDGDGLRFFTSYGSRKGQELSENPRGAVVFYWPSLARQVRAEGVVEQLTAEASDRYFASRPRASRLAALASPQSQPVASRAELEARFEALDREHPGEAVPRPPDWGGYRLLPERWEFWMGAAHRLHDRWEMTRDGQGWRTTRLGP
ncbi:MAG: pyridoxamine 5'-phosphate oxidase [Deltaproteobacteria bacterium]|nr:pyridoxamine 5'-phosphate oxidase [Deltaproteobacteria bacterium]